MYDYKIQKKKLFTEDGMDMFIDVREHVKSLLNNSGAFTLENGIATVTGDSWTMLACIDKLVERGEIIEIVRECSTQRKVFIRGIKS